MPDEAAIEIKNLSVKFGRNVVIPDLSVTIPKGEIIGLLGPSGSGKTTLVKAVMGMIRAAGGEIGIFGKPVPSLDIVSDIGYMAQSDALYDDLTAADNLLFFASLYRLTGEAAKKKAGELLEFVELKKDRKKKVRDFSGGMRRRLSLAIALMHDPKLLLLDEPTVGIDPLLRKKFWDEFAFLKSRGCTILVTTHVMDEAYHCDRILLLREGRILANGSAREIIASTGTADIEEAFLKLSVPSKEES